MEEELESAVCPKCGRADHVIPIIYSCSRSDYARYQRLEKEGKCLLAGCIISVETPVFYCKSCKYNIWESELS
ncbi:MAG: hypothetical protein HZA22_11750 [Nitrospirae bacterium]|nr:hypothetical protein [Nitrospirota bacterium]MBI5696470.1 hypothetical protein [Nitrospirota bacterium]